MPFADLLDEILTLVAEDAEALGCTAEVSHVRDILTRGTSAHRQLKTFEIAQGVAAARYRRGTARVVDGRDHRTPLIVGGRHAGDRRACPTRPLRPPPYMAHAPGPSHEMRPAPHYVSYGAASISGCHVTLSILRPERADVREISSPSCARHSRSPPCFTSACRCAWHVRRRRMPTASSPFSCS